MITREDLKAHRDAVYGQSAQQAVEPGPKPEITYAPSVSTEASARRKIDTNDNRFHALKFALGTHGLAPHEVTRQAEAYLRFLEGQPEPAEPPQDSTFVPADPVNVELADLTQSYSEDEPVIAVADSPQEETWELASAGPAVAEELFEEYLATPAYANPHAEELLAEINAGPADEPVTAEEMRAFIDATNDSEALDAACSPRAEEPTFEHIAAAVQEIASPPPPTPDTTDEPELTDEQVERAEERLATQDPITAAEADPDRELEPAGYVNRIPRSKWSWMP